MKLVLFRPTSIVALVLPISMLFAGHSVASPWMNGYNPHLYDQVPSSESITTTTTSASVLTPTSTPTPAFYPTASSSSSSSSSSTETSATGSSSQTPVPTPIPTSGASHTLNGAYTAFVFGVVLPVALMLA